MESFSARLRNRFWVSSTALAFGLALLLSIVVVSTASGRQRVQLLKDLAPTVFDIASGDVELLVPLGDHMIVGNRIPMVGGIWSFDLDDSSADLLIGRQSSSVFGGWGGLATNGRRLLLEESELETKRIWSTDGTRTGTFVLFESGGFPSWIRLVPFGEEFAFDGRMIFVGLAEDGTQQIWSTDGTLEGTSQLSFVAPSSEPQSWDPRVVALEDRLALFRLNGSGFEVWFTDGTVGGTCRAGEIGGSPRPIDAWSAGSRLYFSATTPEVHDGLYVSDCSGEGTRRIDTPGVWVAWPVKRGASDIAYFVASSFATGQDLWRTDGTQLGTYPITAFNAPEPFPHIEIGFLAMPAGVLFQALSSDLQRIGYWFSSADEPGATEIAGIELPHGPGLEFEDLALFLGEDGRALFQAWSPSTGNELWVSDGASEGARAISDIGPGAADGNIRRLEEARKRVIFEAWTPDRGREIWVSESGSESVRRLSEFANIEPFALPSLSASVKRFIHRDSVWIVASEASDRAQAWSCPLDGGGQARLTRLGRSSTSSWPMWFGGSRSRFGFDICTPYGLQFWTSDGTSIGTIRQPVPSAPCLPGFLRARYWREPLGVGGLLAEWPYGGATQIFQIDESSEIRPLTKFDSGWCCRGARADRKLIYGRNTGDSVELWRSSVVSGETEQISVLDQPAGADQCSALTVESRVGLILASRQDEPSEIWRTDGTQEGTWALGVDSSGLVVPAAAWSPVAFGGGFVFVATDDLGVGLFRYLPGADLIERLSPPEFEVSSSVAYPPALLGRFLAYVTEVSGQYSIVLLSSDSEQAKLIRLPGEPSVTASRAGWKSNGMQLLLSLEVPGLGVEPWISDGTVGGTHLLADINPGAFSSRPTEMTQTSAAFLFSAFEPTRGRELWLADRMANETYLFADIAPGGASSDPWGLYSVGDGAVFMAFREVLGFELWFADLRVDPGSLFSDDFESGGVWNWGL